MHDKINGFEMIDSKLTPLNLQLPEIKNKNKYNFIG